MPAPRAVLPAALALFAVVACRVSTQQNELYEGDQLAESAQASKPSPSRTASAELDASTGDTSDAATDANADSALPLPPPCAVQNMHANAPEETCGEADVSLIGGELPRGNFHLTRWTDERKGCSGAYSQRRGTMSLEEVSGTIFMRWTMTIDGNTTWGTYELTRFAANAYKRSEVCNWTPQTPDVIAEYWVISSDQVLFAHDGGQESWSRIPKVTPQDTVPVEPPF